VTLWTLAAVGALISWVADILCVSAARSGEVWLLAPAMVFFAASGPIWYYMSKSTGGSLVAPAVSWNVIATALSFIAVLAMERHQTPRQWAGLAIVFLGVLVRG
jgi:hypothetical protein